MVPQADGHSTRPTRQQQEGSGVLSVQLPILSRVNAGEQSEAKHSSNSSGEVYGKPNSAKKSGQIPKGWAPGTSQKEIYK